MQKFIYIIWAFYFISSGLFAQNSVNYFKKDLAFTAIEADNLLVINNIYGDIEVESYEGNTIRLETKKTIIADSPALRQEGVEEIEIGVIEKEKIIFIYMKTPCYALSADRITEQALRQREFGWKTWKDCQWKPKYAYRLDYLVKIPANINLEVSTINEGQILIKGVQKAIDANNVNGNITIEGAMGPLNVHTVNGKVTVDYLKLPTEDASFYSLNGNINIDCPKNLAAQVLFKSFNGELYTDMEDVKPISPIVERKQVKKEQGISLKINPKNGFQVGKGGPTLDIETFNANAYLKTKK